MVFGFQFNLHVNYNGLLSKRVYNFLKSVPPGSFCLLNFTIVHLAFLHTTIIHQHRLQTLSTCDDRDRQTKLIQTDDAKYICVCLVNCVHLLAYNVKQTRHGPGQYEKQKSLRHGRRAQVSIDGHFGVVLRTTLTEKHQKPEFKFIFLCAVLFSIFFRQTLKILTKHCT